MRGKELSARWQQDELARLAKLFEGSVELDRSSGGFPRVADRIDLRGIRLPQFAKWTRCRLVGVDLSYADLSGLWVEDCRFEDVVFDASVLDRLTDHGNVFTNCRFVGSSLAGAHLGYRGSRYHRSVFDSVRFRKAGAIRPEFDYCVFRNCYFKGLDFNASSFVGCGFEGRVEDVWFHGGFQYPEEERRFGAARRNRMADVSFEQAELWGVTFSDGCDLSTIKLPLAGEYRLYDNWQARLEVLARVAPAWPEPLRSQANLFVRVHMPHATSQPWHLVNREEVAGQFSEEAATAVLDALDHAVREDLS